MRFPGRIASSLSVLALSAVGLAGVSAPAAAEAVSASDSPASVVSVDDGSVTRTLPVATAGLVDDATVSVTFWNNDSGCTSAASIHYAMDLELTLVSPAGTRVTLVPAYTYGSGYSTAPVMITFDDDAASGVTRDAEEAPVGGTFRPSTPLSTVVGERAEGDWEIEIADVFIFGSTCYYGATLSLEVETAPRLDGAALPGGAVGASYDRTLGLVAASNAATSYTVASGQVPPGLAFDTATGRISGTPTVGGLYRFTVTAINGWGASAPVEYSIAVEQAPYLWFADTWNATAGAAIAGRPMYVPGYPAATVRVAEGALPDGVTIDAATGELSGAATVAGEYPVVLEASNGVGSPARVEMTFVVSPAQVVELTATPSATAVDELESVTFTYDAQDAYGNAVPLTAGDVVLSSDAASDVIAGDAVTFHGGGVHQVTATHTASGVTDAVAIDVTALVPASLAGDASVTVAAGEELGYAPTFDAGYPASGVVTLAEGALPDGVTLDGVTGALSGTATVAGEYPVVLEASNGVGSPARLSVSLEVTPAAPVSLDLVPSTANPDQGGTVTLDVTGVDAFGNVTALSAHEVELTSSVPTDVIDGLTVSFPHASPHTITATHTSTGVAASVLVEVTPAPTPTAEPEATPPEPTATPTAVVTAAELGDTGPGAGTAMRAAVASSLLVLGAVVLAARRRVRA